MDFISMVALGVNSPVKMPNAVKRFPMPLRQLSLKIKTNLVVSAAVDLARGHLYTAAVSVLLILICPGGIGVHQICFFAGGCSYTDCAMQINTTNAVNRAISLFHSFSPR